MIRFFKSPQPAALFSVPFIILVLWLQAFFKHPVSDKETGMLLFDLLSSVLNLLPAFVQTLIAVALISFEAIYLNNILNRYEVLYKNSFLPALMYTLLMSLALPVLEFHPVILVNLLLLRVIDKTFTLFKNDSPIPSLFDSCFLISIASLIYLPAATMFILFLIALLILRPFNLREWMIALIGFGLPYFFLSVYFFWTDQLSIAWKNIIQNFVPAHLQFGFTIEKPLMFLFIMLGLILLLSLKRLVQHFYKNTVRTRSYQQILILFFIIAAASSFLLKTIPLYQMTILAIPLAVFFGYYFLAAKRRIWFSEMLLWILIGLIVWNHF